VCWINEPRSVTKYSSFTPVTLPHYLEKVTVAVLTNCYGTTLFVFKFELCMEKCPGKNNTIWPQLSRL